MRSLNKILEGLLDADFDIKDSDVMPGVKNWPRFISRLQTIGKPKKTDPKSWMWKTEDVLKAISQGAKSDIGPTIGKNAAIDAAIDREQIVIALFQRRGEPWASQIYIGNNDGHTTIKSSRLGFTGPVVVTATNATGYLSGSLETNVASNWKYRLVPLQCYDIIKRELGLIW